MPTSWAEPASGTKADALNEAPKDPEAFRTISEVATELSLPQHVLRFWETKFSQIKPMKRGGGRRYYRPDDVALLRGIQFLLYSEGYTIKGVQRILKERGARAVAEAPEQGVPPPVEPTVPERRAVPVAEAQSRASGEGTRADGDLRRVLAELLECKRLLDQVR